MQFIVVLERKNWFMQFIVLLILFVPSPAFLGKFWSDDEDDPPPSASPPPPSPPTPSPPPPPPRILPPPPYFFLVCANWHCIV